MDDYPRTSLEFQTRFATEEACRAYLMVLRWPNGFVCPNCGTLEFWEATRDRLVCVDCRHQTSVTAGTIFAGTRKPLRMWFHVIWQVMSEKNGSSAMAVKQALGMRSYATAWTWLHKLRRAMVRPERDRLQGLVDADETYVGGLESGVRGRKATKKALVGVAAEVRAGRIGRIRLACLPNASRSALHGFLRDSVEPGSTIHTDGLPAYANLEQWGYVHQVSNLIATGNKDAATNLLPHVHRVASLLKRWLLGTHQGAIRNRHLPYYLDEFTFRFNRRTSRSRGKLFWRLLQQAVEIEPTYYREIVGGTDHNI
jgi:transposase-like protein